MVWDAIATGSHAGNRFVCARQSGCRPATIAILGVKAETATDSDRIEPLTPEQRKELERRRKMFLGERPDEDFDTQLENVLRGLARLGKIVYPPPTEPKTK